MCLHGCILFADTPRNLRKGRLRFIIIGVGILVLSAVTVSLKAWCSFLELGPGASDFTSRFVPYQTTVTMVFSLCVVLSPAIAECMMVSSIV